MNSRYLLAALAVGTMPLAQHAHAHGYAGDHMFISTLLIDDPNVADEASLPTFSFLPQPTDGGPAANQYGLEFELDKRITENFGFAINRRLQLAHPARREDRERLEQPRRHLEIQTLCKRVP